MDRNYELFRIATSAVREMNVRRERVTDAGNDPRFVAYHAAELAEYANKAEIAQEMLRVVLSQNKDNELYAQAWKHVIEGESDEMTALFIDNARKGL